MKKALIFAMFAILLVGSVFALGTISNARDNSDDNEHNETLVGASCGTVTPGENNDCCISKGYSGWNESSFKCIGEKEDNETEANDDNENSQNHVLGSTLNNKENDKRECDAWKCSKWSACINGKETRSCSKLSNCTNNEEKPKITKSCSEKDRLGKYNRTADCPENCTCSGSTSKCSFENGTRVMTIYAGNSGNVIVQVKNINMSTNVTLYKSINGTLYAVFTGNRTHEIKFPDEIKDRLENHTKTKLYNESINLTEDGYYVMDMNKKSRLFFLFPVREHMKAQIDAQTGETIKIRNPWWGFLAKDVKDKDNSTIVSQ
jgi:hypothetical protein